MIRLIKLIFYITLLLFAFFSGVKYSQQTKEIANWLFEAKEKEIDFHEIKKDLNSNPQPEESTEDFLETIPEEITEETLSNSDNDNMINQEDKKEPIPNATNE